MPDLAVNNSILYLTSEERFYLRIYLEKKYKLIIIARTLLLETSLPRSFSIYTRILKL